MSTYFGHMGKGARRAHLRDKRIEAYNRALAIWNDGTGRLVDKDLKPVQHPYFKLPAKMRPAKPGDANWPIMTADFPKAEKIFAGS